VILVDTSVWVEHLRKGNSRLAALLEDARVLCHPFVQGELACGNLRQRREILALLRLLPSAVHADHDEVLRMIDAERLHGDGLGWVDAHLLASARLTRCGLWTLDRTLERAASRLAIGES
jgi:predicted nucleic acid-binding protein